MDDMRSAGVDFLTMGQYLQPAAPRKGRGIRHSAGVRRVCGHRAGQGLPARQLHRSAVELSRRRRFQEDAGGPQRATGAGERLMPRHTETKHLPYTPDQLFDLVADVARYDEFLPWVVAVRVRSSSPTETIADLVVGFNAFKERFTSRVMKERPNRICVDYIEGPLKFLHNEWKFDPAPDGAPICASRSTSHSVRGSSRRSRARCSTGLAANDARLRGARGRSLRHQQIERAERRLKPDPGAPGFIEELLVGMICDGSLPRSARRRRRCRPAFPVIHRRSGDPGNCDGNVGL